MSLSAIAGQWRTRLARHIPPGQFGRYLLVGIGNTVFSYVSYAGVTALLTPYVPYAYILAGALANVLSITFSYLTYKWFVFRTRGNYIHEWLRCVAVYGGAGLLGVATLPLLVFIIRRLSPLDAAAPYLAGGIVAALTMIVSFTGHKRFTFRPVKP